MRIFLSIALAFLACAAQAASVFLEDLTSPEVREAIAAGKTTILIPIGGTEQNGPHMALGKHNVRAKALAGKIAAQLGNAIVAPVVAYVPEGAIDPPSEHMRHPGTVTVPQANFERTLESAARGFRLHGFRDIVLLGDHGGYQKNLAAAAARLNREWGRSGARVHALPEYYRTAEGAYAAALRAKGFSAEEIGAHAGLADTALTLAIDPALVRADRLKDPPRREDGVQGDPRKATAELGEVGVALIVSATVEAIRRAARRWRSRRTGGGPTHLTRAS
jgi:creatinine amidohydrolase/Fe(II)-dependent formamide hydrolase-like protein